MNVVGAVVVLGNLMVIFHPPKLGLGRVPGALDLLPERARFAVFDGFLMTGMFNSYAVRNLEPVVRGRLVEPGPDGERVWRRLPLDDFFPRGVGTEYTRFIVARHGDMLGRAALRRGWRSYTRQIRARHNRMHPDAPIDRVELGADQWPMSIEGFDAERTPAQTEYTVWYER